MTEILEGEIILDSGTYDMCKDVTPHCMFCVDYACIKCRNDYILKDGVCLKCSTTYF